MRFGAPSLLFLALEVLAVLVLVVVCILLLLVRALGCCPCLRRVCTALVLAGLFFGFFLCSYLVSFKH